MRFDYYGTGNSPGNDREPALVRAWVDSIHAAIDFMTGVGGVEEVCLFGTRLGATLAAAAASEHGAGRIKGLALWNPFDTGGDFCREILFAQKLTARDGEDQLVSARRPDADREVSGFVLTASTMADLGRLNLLAIAEPPAPRALVLARRAALPEVRLLDRLRSLDVQTEHEFIPGIAGTMVAPDQSVLPTRVIGRVTNWIADLSQSQAQTARSRARDIRLKTLASSTCSKESVKVDDAVCETALRFGNGGTLFGIVSEPRCRPAKGTQLGIVFISPGAVHSTGANRLYVTMARHCAAVGYPAMRFDFSGVGDSPVADATEESVTSTREKVLKRERDGVIGRDIQAAMNALEDSCGVNRFVLFGMCSGARMAFHSAIDDGRAVGAVLINAPFFHVEDSPPGHATRDGFVSLSQRSVYPLLLYSPQDVGIDYIEREAGDTLRRAGISADILPGADHDMSRLSAQANLLELLTEYLGKLAE